jgi:3-dehydroquinate synthase
MILFFADSREKTGMSPRKAGVFIACSRWWTFKYNISVATVPVNLPGLSYNIHVEPGLLSRTGSALRELNTGTKAMILTDQTVGPLLLPALQASLQSAGFTCVVATITPGEDHKTLVDILPVFDTFLHARIERNTPVLALGGGIVGDMAGFVAASILRGVPFVQIPTTLLAMVDASVGGKTGVNHAVGKNLIGAFHQPIAVLADPQLLRTLPRRELIGGLAECIKHEVIRDADGFAALEQNLDAILDLDLAQLTDLVAHNVRIKARVVEADPLEHGERAHLNFGHTFGHALERVYDYSYSHGECVALGMIAASRLAVDLDMLDPAAAERIIRMIARAGLPTTAVNLNPAAVLDAMAYDKKVKSSRIRFVLPDRIGHVLTRDDVPREMVVRAIDRLAG